MSACLAGLCTDWRGGSDLIPWVQQAVARGEAIPVCPEQLGGLPTPRVPSERRGECVVSETGRDVTEAFRRGAERAVEIARGMGCEIAVLASRSPSCGVGKICDGTFSGTLVPGDGVTAERLRQEGLRVISSEDVPDPSALHRIIG
ncbi:DUF523 domain-containing protein [Candidatus Sumerlaeota bacterium]|nr:DUF523 domain-containing protein [Candidatus Sumerlaeota bacterium]